MKFTASLPIAAAATLMVATSTAAELSDAGVENLVKRSYQFVAM
jgi:hypothetical protein